MNESTRRCRYRYGRFELQPGERRLLAAGVLVAVEPRAFDVLVALVERAGHLVTKEELFSLVWPKLIVEEGNLHVQVSALRKILGPTAIATVAGQGYRFVMEPTREVGDAAPRADPVEAIPNASEQAARRHPRARLRQWQWLAGAVVVLLIVSAGAWLLQSAKTMSSTTDTEPPTLSIAILPFSASAGSPADEHLADVLTEDVTAALGRNMQAARLASHTLTEIYKGKPIDARAVGKELNVRYLARGELRRAGEQIVVNLQLVDAGNGTQVWSDQVTFDDAHEHQSSLVAQLTYRVGNALYRTELRRAGTRPTAGADAMELSLRAVNVESTTSDRLTGAVEAGKLFDEALRLDPNHVFALFGRADTLDTQLRYSHLSRADHDRLVEQMDELTRRAVAINDNSPLAWGGRTYALVWQKRLEAALEANARTLRLDPIRAVPVMAHAALMLQTGHAPEALDLANQALAKDPQIAVELAYGLSVRCNAALFLGRYEEAIDSCEKSVALYDEWWVHAYLVAAYAQKSDSAKAAAEKATLLQMRPWYSITDDKDLLISNDPTYLQQIETHFYAGLRKAGIPEK